MWQKLVVAFLLLSGISGTYGLHRLIKSYVNPKESVWHFMIYMFLHFALIFLMVFAVSFIIYKIAVWGNLK